MIDLNDLSVVIPYRYDTQDRENNLKVVVKYFKQYFINYELIILENAPEQKGKWLESESNVTYRFEQNNDLLHRTKMLNDGAKMSTRKFVSLYDTDVVFHPDAIQTTMNQLRNNRPFVYPYNGVFLTLEKPHNWFVDTLDFTQVPNLPKNGGQAVGSRHGKDSKFVFIHPNSDGGATFFNKEIFLKYGGYNKRFISWGWEDNEIVCRFLKLGIPPVKIEGYNLIHLDHDRGINSGTNHPKHNDNQAEFSRVSGMSLPVLIEYIKKDLL